MAAEAGVPIVPVIVWGSQRIWTKGQPRHLMGWPGRNEVTVAVGAPLPASASMAGLRESMTTMLHCAQEQYPHPAGAYWVPQRLGGGAPTLTEATALDAEEAAGRRQRRSG